MSHPNHSNAPGGPRAFDNTSKLVAIAIGVLAGIAGLVVGIVNPFMSDAASTQGVLIDAPFRHHARPCHRGLRHRPGFPALLHHPLRPRARR